KPPDHALRPPGKLHQLDGRDHVLDGQQRLTSLFAALKGLTVRRESGATDDFSEIYIDLEAKDSDTIVKTDVERLEQGSYIKITDLLYGGLKQLASYPDQYLTKLELYKKRIESYDFSIIEVKGVPTSIATEIFTRINVGGKALTVFEIMVAKTYDEEAGFDLAEKYDELVDRLSPLEYETISDQSILQLISLILRRDCKKQTILSLDRSEFIATWPKTVESVESAVEYFRGTMRIPVSQLLPYLGSGFITNR
ncbi:GmrSD restriction endonuclease domain-containing protein, partial [Paracoccus rhizosphaerae]